MSAKKGNQITQADALFAEVKRTCGNRFMPGKTEARILLSNREIDRIANLISDKIERKEVYYGKPIPERPILFRYVKTVIFNLLKKNKKLNGGKVYEPNVKRGKRMGKKNGRKSDHEASGCSELPTSTSTGRKKAKSAKASSAKEKAAPEEKAIEAFSTVIYSDEAKYFLEKLEK
jgi:hypothetical protein